MRILVIYGDTCLLFFIDNNAKYRLLASHIFIGMNHISKTSFINPGPLQRQRRNNIIRTNAKYKHLWNLLGGIQFTDIKYSFSSWTRYAGK